MTTPLDEFVADARAVSIAEAAVRLDLKLRPSGSEHPQPCPACGGKDRFSFNTVKNEWVCRGASVGGHDAIGMAAHCEDLDLKRRDGFLAACALVTGRPVPEGGETESDADRAARRERLEAKRMAAYEEMARQQAGADVFREKERAKARGIFEAARSSRATAVEAYLMRRCGCGGSPWLRFSAAQTFWHDGAEIHCGPAMVAAFIVPTAEGRGSDRSPPDGSGAPAQGQPRSGGAAREREFDIIGCHITWIDLDRAPKFRPSLVDPATGEALPTKKMRGSKKGGVIPLAGAPSARRWVGGEGIENTLAFGRAEGFRADTFYFAAGDLGNMAGPADPAARFAHPELTKPDRNGVARRVMVAGPVPKPDSDGEAMHVPDHIDELVLLADGDSEPVMTASAMARARARHARPGRIVPVVWARQGTDFAAMLAGADAAYGPSTLRQAQGEGLGDQGEAAA